MYTNISWVVLIIFMLNRKAEPKIFSLSKSTQVAKSFHMCNMYMYSLLRVFIGIHIFEIKALYLCAVNRYDFLFFSDYWNLSSFCTYIWMFCELRDLAKTCRRVLISIRMWNRNFMTIFEEFEKELKLPS